ncbi:MAG: hypothetical protein IV092_14295 [Burkholderiaceae bacterium]|nr:hypothetical protein [Burkholderiaceae bacterium]
MNATQDVTAGRRPDIGLAIFVASYLMIVAAVMDAGALMRTLSALVAWLCIVIPHRRMALRQLEALS